MPVLRKPQHELFSQIMAVGNVSAGKAYAICYPDVEAKSAETLGPKLFRNLQIQERVAELQGEAAKQAVITLAEWQKWHRDAMFTPIAEIDENHYLAQEMTYETKGGARGRLKRGQADEGNEEASEPIEVVKVKSVCKQASAAQLGKHFGWTKEAVEHSGTVGVEGLGDLLGSICRPGLPHRQEMKPPTEPEK
jgi:hypothetical protein